MQKLLFKRGTKEALELKLVDSLKPLEGEPIFELDTGKFKIGNGLDNYADLAYISGSTSEVQEIIVKGYYYNNKFYEDAGHQIEIEGVINKLYLDISTNKIYNYDTKFNACIDHASDETPGIIKLYNIMTDAEDGTLTSKVIKENFGEVNAAISEAETNINEINQKIIDIEEDIEDLQVDSHTHANKAELDLIETGDKAKWDAEIGAKAIAEANDARLDVIEGEGTGSIKKAVADEAVIARAAEQANATAISDEEERATGIESGLNTRLTTAEGAIDTLEDKVETIEGKPAYNITAQQITNWNNEVGAKAAVESEEERATGIEEGLQSAVEAIEGREASWDAKLNTIKIDDSYLTVKTNAEYGKYVDLSSQLKYPGQIISGIKATGTVTEIQNPLTPNTISTQVVSSGSYTPAGTISGDITPTGTVTVASETKIASKIIDGGQTPTFIEGNFTKASIDYVNNSFTTDGVIAQTMALDETNTKFVLQLSSAEKKAASLIADFFGGEKAKDTFTAGSMPVAADVTVGSVKPGSTLTLDTIALNVDGKNLVSFDGTSATITVAGNYDKVKSITGNLELGVADIPVEEKVIIKN